MKMLIVTAGRYPVPAVKGGAVATLTEYLIKDNEENKVVDLEVVSPYDAKAKEKAEMYSNANVHFVKTPVVCNALDFATYKIFTKLRPQKNWVQMRSISAFGWFILQTALILKKGQYDAVIFENTARLYYALSLFGNAKRYQDKVYYHLHNEPKKLASCRKYIVQSKNVICISEYVRASILSKQSALAFPNRDRTSVLRNCIDPDLFKPLPRDKIAATRKEWGIAEQDKVIIFSGRIDKEKGILEVLKAFEKVRSKDVKLLVVGSSFYGMNVKTAFEMEVMTLAQTMKDRIVFTGFVPYSKMPAIYNAANIAVLPSMWEEPAGMTIIEAMACGLPVITTRSGGIPEYAGKNCFLLERNEKIVARIAEKIDELLCDADGAQKLGEEASLYVRKNFAYNGYMHRMYEIIASATLNKGENSEHQ